MYTFHEHYPTNVSDARLQFEVWSIGTTTNNWGPIFTYADPHFARSVSPEVNLNDTLNGQWVNAPLLTNTDLTIHTGELLVLKLIGDGQFDTQGVWRPDRYSVDVEAVASIPP
jgi:hypothetical protein